MARKTPLIAQDSATRIQTRGPLGPGVPDITIFAASEAGKFLPTPVDMTYRAKQASILLTDDPSTAARFPHRELKTVGEAGARMALLRTHFDAKRLPHDERTIYVAGSAELVSAACDDAWRVILECGNNDPIPHTISSWRTQRAKGSTTTTITRD